MQVQNCRCKLQQFLGVLRKRFRVGAHTRGVFLAKIRTYGPYFGHMAPFSLTLDMGASCTCTMQVQAKLQQFWGSLRKSPTPSVIRRQCATRCGIYIYNQSSWVAVRACVNPRRTCRRTSSPIPRYASSNTQPNDASRIDDRCEL